jgi:hypothetical protein
LHNGDIKGVKATKIDKFDNAFSDGTDLMNVDLPDNSALSQHRSCPAKESQQKIGRGGI